MIRASRHNITEITNQGKLNYLDQLFIDYKHDLEIYINYIIDGLLPLKTMLTSSLLPSENIKHSQYKQIIYKDASEIVRSQIEKCKKRRYSRYKKIYSYFKNNGRQLNFTNKKFSELKIKNIISSRFFTIPKIKNVSINLDERLFNVSEGKHFDNFIKINLPYFQDSKKRAIQIKLPLKQHKHSNQFKNDNFNLRKNIQLKKINDQYFINLIWFKEIKNKSEGKILGFDLGANKLIATSRGEIIGDDLKDIYQKINKKKQGSKNFKNLLKHRDNLINFHVNKINLDDIKDLIIEDLKNVKHGKKLKYSNKNKEKNYKLERWSYKKTIEKITRTCEVKGINLVKVSPAYTSQTCSCCGYVDENSRDLENFKCVSCEYELDADINAAINIHNRGVYSPST